MRSMRNGYQALDDNASERSHWLLLRKAFTVMWPSSSSEHINALALKLRLIVSLLVLLLGKVAELVSPFALKMAIDSLDQDPARFPLAGLLLFGIGRILAQFFGELKNVIYASVSASAERVIALDTFEHLQRLSLRYHLSRKTGSVLRSVSRGASSFSSVLRVIIFNIAPVIVQVLIVCVYLLINYEWWFALITFCTILSYFVFTMKTTSWRNKFRRKATELDNEFNQKATDALLNFETVKFFNSEEHEKSRYDMSLRKYRDASIVSQQTLSVLNMGQNVCISVGVVLSMWLAALQVVKGSMSPGDFILIQSFVFVLYQPLGFLGTYYSMLRQYLVDIESMLTILEEPIDIVDVPNAYALDVRNGLIEFRNVSFSYSRETPVLKSVSFKILPGQHVAIVGPSGAGKSTIARLLYRFYDINGGQILIDGQNIAHCQQNSLRSQIGIVPQDTVLFNDTIKYNIGYGIKGREKRDATDAEIDEAAKAASIFDFIMSQKDGYDTKCGERGLRLSGGEKQRVAIARAILKRPKIMLFDEATSSLDTGTERAIQASLDAVSSGRSTLVIAHRLSTVVKCDRILVLKQGSIVEQGTHDELLEIDGEYAKLWQRQKKDAELLNSLEQLRASERIEM